MSHKKHRNPERNKLDEILREEQEILRILEPKRPTSTRFTEITMNPTEAGQSQVFTGTFVPAGSIPPADAVYAITSNDPAVSPTVDSTGLIVSVTYPPAPWAESTTTPLVFTRTASSASVPSWILSDVITPSAPPVTTNYPTSTTFVQTQ